MKLKKPLILKITDAKVAALLWHVFNSPSAVRQPDHHRNKAVESVANAINNAQTYEHWRQTNDHLRAQFGNGKDKLLKIEG